MSERYTDTSHRDMVVPDPAHMLGSAVHVGPLGAGAAAKLVANSTGRDYSDRRSIFEPNSVLSSVRERCLAAVQSAASHAKRHTPAHA